MSIPALIVHGGAGALSEDERDERQGAVERGLRVGWERIGESALSAVVAAVVQLEDEPILNAGVGACLNADGEVELDAGVMEGTGLRTGAVAAVRDVCHPVELAMAVMEDGRHVLLVAAGASRFADSAGIERCDPASFVTERQLRRWRNKVAAGDGDTVGAVARDARGTFAVAVSTGGVGGKLAGRVGDSALVGAGFYADDARGAACGTGVGEFFVRALVCKCAVDQLATLTVEQAASAALEHLGGRLQAAGGIIVVGRDGPAAASHTTPYMPSASRFGG